MGKLLTVADLPPNRERICLYGRPKSGKTRLIGSLPRNEKWGKILYIAADANSERLKTIMRVDENILVYKPGPDGPGKPWDPMTEYVELATKDWSAVDPGIGTIVIDTGTEVTRQLLGFYTDTNAVQANHRSLGARGTKAYHAAPDKGDYGAVQRTHDFLLGHLFAQPLHVIVLYQEDWVEPKSGGLDDLTGGPATVGIATIRTLPAIFDTVLRTTSSQSARFAVQTERMGAWPAEIRNSTGRRLGEAGFYSLKEDPFQFWLDYDNFVAPPAAQLNLPLTPSIQPSSVTPAKPAAFV